MSTRARLRANIHDQRGPLRRVNGTGRGPPCPGGNPARRGALRLSVKRAETPDGRSAHAPKLDSRAAGLRITLEPAAKVIRSLRALFPRSFLVGWKFEMAASPEELRAKAGRQLTENATDLCVVNGPAYGAGMAICNRTKDTLHLPDKTALARQLVTMVTAKWQATGGAAIRPESQSVPGNQTAPSTLEPDSIPDAKHQSLGDAVVAILEQGLALLDALEPEAYTQRLPQAFNAAIGGHYRHCLEHFEILLRSQGRTIDFDARRRDERIETDLDCARQATASLLADARNLDLARLDAAVEVRSDLNLNEAATVTSSRARETLYAISHAVHHYALIGIMGQILEVRLPPGFGVAPSTLRYQRSLATR